MVVMLTVAFNQFVNPWAIEAIGWWYYIVYCGWLVIELVFVITFIVETKGLCLRNSAIFISMLILLSLGRTLEETAAIFDGEDQEQVGLAPKSLPERLQDFHCRIFMEGLTSWRLPPRVVSINQRQQ